MRTIKEAGVLAILLLLGVLVAGSPALAGQASATIPQGGTLKVATIGEPPNLDVMTLPADLVTMIGQHIFEQLFAFDEKYDIKPMLAQSYNVSADGKTYTIQLRQGVKFHNGQDMTSADVVASLNRWTRVSSRGKIASNSLEGVSAPSASTVVIKLKTPFAPLLSFLAFQNTAAAIMPKAIIDKFGDKVVTEYVGTGPYRFEDWKPDFRIRLTRFTGYSPRTEVASGFAGRKTAYLDAIEFYPVTEAGARIAGVESGDYQYAYSVSKEAYPRLSKNANLMTLVISPGQWGWLIFNKKQGIAANQGVRQAALAALNMEPILRAAYGLTDFYQMEPSYYPKGTAWYSTAGAKYYNQKNPALAKQLLAKAGYKNEPLRIICTKEYEYMYNIGVTAASQLKEAGFNVDLQVYDWATVLDRRGKPDMYDAFVTGHGFVPDPSLITIMSSQYPGWWDSPEKNDLLAKFNSTTQMTARKQLWDKLQELIYTQVPVIRVGQEKLFDVATAKLVNYWPSVWPSFWNVGLSR
ncbi:MAG TPA: ABC transporter substrate-binding protein [Candidatus Methylomirabilis sp.]|nr:ABC transporter substrate-binding protein [Candidatus Methylomirabilis sp.]